MTVIGKVKVVREPGFMYFVKDGYVWATPMKGKGGSRHKVNDEFLAASKGKRCWINKQGYAETP
jgi:hypothetical protein